MKESETGRLVKWKREKENMCGNAMLKAKTENNKSNNGKKCDDNAMQSIKIYLGNHCGEEEKKRKIKLFDRR